ncbi:helix-turn-helix domain-containing protein|uniref:helix-turn-helix domain-containing protein n=1 Tax=Noviherbaspirillum sp. L7-7A TaxID=2850560 RepID=UPI001C2CA794|nr:helix-turn-helix domain-containing protein [Noviherbaspirillum sp. L7-7A]MBV0878473.1 helix-turn-helix domain-containing protein [Noviherbaspirillum sp. L7-7A]
MTEPTEHASQQVPAEHGQPTPGMQLAMRRQQFNWTVDQVARQLNLAPRQIVAMEADDYGALPGMAVARGFIRAYAKLLQLDATPMLAQIAQAPGMAEQAIPLRRAIPTTTFTPHRAASRRRQRGPGKLLTIGGVIVVAFAAAALISQRDRLAELVPPSVAERLSKDAAPVPTAAADKLGRVVETEVTPPLSHADAGGPLQAAPVPLGTTTEPPAPAPAAQVPLAVATPASASALVLNFKQDSWVEVKRPDNSTVVARVMRAGTTESFDLAGPLSLTVGNARGVEASVRGEPLNLTSTTRNNVARVTVK